MVEWGRLLFSTVYGWLNVDTSLMMHHVNFNTGDGLIKRNILRHKFNNDPKWGAFQKLLMFTGEDIVLSCFLRTCKIIKTFSKLIKTKSSRRRFYNSFNNFDINISSLKLKQPIL